MNKLTTTSMLPPKDSNRIIRVIMIMEGVDIDFIPTQMWEGMSVWRVRVVFNDWVRTTRVSVTWRWCWDVDEKVWLMMIGEVRLIQERLEMVEVEEEEIWLELFDVAEDKRYWSAGRKSRRILIMGAWRKYENLLVTVCRIRCSSQQMRRV